MTNINVKEIATKLFGVVDNEDDEEFRKVFSAGDHQIHQIDFNEAIFIQVSNAIGREIDETSAGLCRFVTTGYRTGSDPIGGTQMGDLAEVISYLIWLAAGSKITRIVTYESGEGEHEFPMPDFFVEEDGKLGALEVKSSLALNVHELRKVVESNSNRNWRHLTPCSNVVPRRKDALRQLGYDKNSLVSQKHRLVLRDDTVVLFPADFGIVHVHLVRDGRLDSIRSHQNAKRLKTVGACAEKSRSCWTCLNEHISLVSMHNAPNSLGLLGAGSNGLEWHKAYTRWTEAMWSYDPHALELTQQKLARITNEWIRQATSNDADSAPVLRGMWDRYFGEVLLSRGLLNKVDRPRFDAGDMVDGFVRGDRTTKDVPNLVIQDRVPIGWALDGGVRRLYAGESERNESAMPGVFLSLSSENLEVRCLSRRWSRGVALNRQQAIDVCQDLLNAVWTATGNEGRAIFAFQNGLEELNVPADAADSENIPLGWQFRSTGEWRSVTATVNEVVSVSSHWLLALSMGDPRCRLIVHPDGRGHVQLPRALLTSTPRAFGVSL